MMNTCSNCNSSFSGNFCNNCGQKKDTGRLTFAHITHEIVHAFTHADKGFFVLAKKMLLQAGTVAYEYIVACKRKKYFNLFTFFVLVTAIASFAESKDLALKEQLFNTKNEYGHAFNIYSKLLNFIFIPQMALVLWLLYARRSKILFSEYTVLAMVLVSVKSLIDIFFKVANYLLTLLSKKDIVLDDSIPYVLLLLIMVGWVTYTFHKPLIGKHAGRAFITAICFMLLQVLIYLFIVWGLFNHFKGLGIFYMFGIRISG
jgi:hypothetical protein